MIRTQKGHIEQIIHFSVNILVSRSRKYGRTTGRGELISGQDGL